LQIRIGGRFDHLTLETDNRLTSQNSRRKRSRFSPQAGVVYELSDPVTIYAAYGQGFRANVGTNVNGQIFDPENSESFEAGAKLSL
ncbi:TonB-dependent receptor domain-containing protein, partial [Novosphingobium sp. HR1a]